MSYSKKKKSNFGEKAGFWKGYAMKILMKSNIEQCGFLPHPKRIFVRKPFRHIFPRYFFQHLYLTDLLTRKFNPYLPENPKFRYLPEK